MTYQDEIRAALARRRRLDVDPRAVEELMRMQYGTLDHLDAATFASEVAIGIECWDAAPDLMRDITALSAPGAKVIGS